MGTTLAACDTLDRPSKPMGKEAETDERASEIEDREMDFGQALVTDSEPAEAIEPGEGRLRYPAMPPERLAGL